MTTVQLHNELGNIRVNQETTDRARLLFIFL